MAAPSYVPATENPPTAYRSAPWRDGSWTAVRPGEVVGAPEGPELGFQGPDQGYALKLAGRFADRLVLAPGEQADDALAGCCAVALRRASLFGRAPVVHDLRLALEVLGLLDQADDELVEWRGPLLAGAASHHGHHQQHHLATQVPESTLLSTPEAVAAARRSNWRTPLGLT